MKTKLTTVKRILIFSILILPLSNMIADDWKELVNLKGYWKFNIGDEKDWAKFEFNDNSWDEIKVPSSWEDEGYHGYNGYAWYRTDFYLSKSNKNKSVYLSLGYIDDVDEVYLNGKLIGASGLFPPNYRTAYNAYRKYPIPTNLLNYDGKNIIAVRVYDEQMNGGITSGDISVMILESLDLDVNLDGKWKFKTGDSLQWNDPKYIDKDWNDILVPSYWEINGYQDYDGFAWYRKRFYADKKLVIKKLIVLLGKIDDIDQCYLNGKMIGSTGDFETVPIFNNVDQEWQELRAYYVPQNLLKIGEENVISVRVYDGYLDGGIYQGPIGITTQEEYRKYWKEKKQKKSFWDFLFDN